MRKSCSNASYPSPQSLPWRTPRVCLECRRHHWSDTLSRPVTLITGASRGIGLATLLRLSGDGHEVIGLARTPPPVGTPGHFVAADLASSESTAAALADVTRRFAVDNVVANAGLQLTDRASEVTLDGLHRTFQVNVRAVLQCLQACLPGMRARRHGRMVIVGSRAALGRAGRVSYATSKGALLSLARSFALEVGRDGITVNVVAPGPIVTELFLEHNGQDYIDRMSEQAPMKRLGRPEDVAGAIAFLLGRDASFITGQVLYVCGGTSIGQAPM